MASCGGGACGSGACGSLPKLPEKPYQPTEIAFPRRPFRKSSLVYRSFQSAWFRKWKWLHYDVGSDKAYCFTCLGAIQAGHHNKIKGNIYDSTLVSGFCNWKDATRWFSKHESTISHRAASDFLIQIPASTQDVGGMLSSTHKKQQESNRQYLIKIAQNIRFLCRQGIALRGNGTEVDSNFMQLLQVRAIDDPEICDMLEKKAGKYTSPQIQNEIIKIMSLNILRKIASNIQEARYFALMADEVIDCSNKEQFVICLRWVNNNFQPFEDFIGLYNVESITANNLVECLKDCLLRMNISLSNCRAQCYDGASNMCGSRSGVSTQISDEEHRAIFVHCFGHALNLAAGDTIKQNKILRNSMDTTHEISKLLKFSPRREALFQKLKEDISPEYAGFRTLCPTRWTVRASSLASVINNYSVLQALWDEALEISTDSEIRARLIGVKHCMSTFEYLFGVMLGQLILRHTDNLSKTLQSPKLCSSEGLKIARLTKKKTLESLRNEENSNMFWSMVISTQQKLTVNDPVLPRKQSVPQKLSTGAGSPYYPSDPKEHYRKEYFECFDLIIAFVERRFDQPGMQTLRNLEDLILKAARKENYSEELKYIVDFYKDDITEESLSTQLQTLPACLEKSTEKPSIPDIVDYLRSLSPAQQVLLSEVSTLLKIILVSPATNAASERSASSLRRIKTYLRATMSEKRLNNLMVLNVHKDKTDELDIRSCLNEFVQGVQHRSNMFGQF